MSKMVPIPGKDLVRVLQVTGYKIKRWKGSHAILDNGQRIVVVPCHGNQDLPKGTQRAILRDAELSVDQFNSLLKQI